MTNTPLTSPVFSIITATYNRGRHIIPTLASVFGQSLKDFEIIIVGDGCTDDTAAVLAPYLSEQVRWFNLPRNTGSQAFPNNRGMSQARGQYIAFLGHDDVWAKDHLELLRRQFEGGVDFAVSGCVYHGPRGGNFLSITGLWENQSEIHKHFFPPSSFALTQSAVKKIGPWRDAHKLRAPVDADYGLRADALGLQFGSTGQITVHKFAAGHRYLYYLEQTSFEQKDMVQFLAKNDTPEWRQSLIEKAKAARLFMTMKHPDYSAKAEGEMLHRNARNRGLHLPGLAALSGPVVLKQDGGPRAIDWELPVADAPFRWSLHNPVPKILIPFTSTVPVAFRCDVHGLSEEAQQDLGVRVNGQPVQSRLALARTGISKLHFIGQLCGDRHSIVQLHAPLGRVANNKIRGIAIGDIHLEPLDMRQNARLAPLPSLG